MFCCLCVCFKSKRQWKSHGTSLIFHARRHRQLIHQGHMNGSGRADCALFFGFYSFNLTVDITITIHRRETEADRVTLFTFTQNYEVVKPESKYRETKVIID